MSNELCITTDFMDDLLNAGRVYDKQDLDAMMAYCASLGATRHEWILDTMWKIYDEYAGGFDLLAEACEAAHRHGMRFDVVFKPFEGGIGHPKNVLPHSLPRPEGVPVIDGPGGLVHAARPFVAAYPEMRMARPPEDDDTGGRIAAIRLVKSDDDEARFGADDLTLWYSATNGNGSLKQYAGPVTFHESLDWRPRFPHVDTPCRVLTLAGLDLPADARYFRIDCARHDENGTFTNEVTKLIELVDEHGDTIPITPSQGRVDAEGLYERTVMLMRLGLSRLAAAPEVRQIIEDREQFLSHCRDMYSFEAGGGTHATLDRDGEFAFMRGSAKHIIGALNPSYPEVREHWLEHVQFCIDRNVDGVNIRLASHNRPGEPWRHGFNEPVREKMHHKDNMAEAARINGEGYTQFLRDARELLHKHNRELGVHVHQLVFTRDDRHGKPFGPILQNVEWQWQAWIRELADYVEYRGASMGDEHSIRYAIDRIGLAAHEAGIPFIYQSTRSAAAIRFDGPFHRLTHEMAMARSHPYITCYNLYEIDSFSHINSDDRFEGSADIANLVRSCWHEPAAAEA